MDREITLDDFWLGEMDLANLAGHLLTERERTDDSVWSGDPFGSDLVRLLEQPGAEELVRRELERVLGVVQIDGQVDSVAHAASSVSVLDAQLSITTHRVTVI